MTKLKAGFFCDEGVPFNASLADLWAHHVEVEGMPLCFRLHDYQRDYPAAAEAAKWGRNRGMMLFLSITDLGVQRGSARERRVMGDGWSVSYGNGHDAALADIGGTHVQDDSGPVGAMQILRAHDLFPREMLFHAYGQSGMRAKENLPILKAAANRRGVRLVWSECGWGFPGKDKTIGDRPDVTAAGSGAWTREAVIEAESHGIPCAIYKPKYFFTDDGFPNAAGDALFGYSSAKPHTPPRYKAWKMTWSMKNA
jgi:hypothetical protein